MSVNSTLKHGIQSEIHLFIFKEQMDFIFTANITIKTIDGILACNILSFTLPNMAFHTPKDRQSKFTIFVFCK